MSNSFVIYEPEDIKIHVRRSSVNKRLCMRFTPPNKILLSCPRKVPEVLLLKFINQNRDWIIKIKERIKSAIDVRVGVKIPFKGRLVEVFNSDKNFDHCIMHKNKILVGAGAKPTGHQVRDFLIREIALTVEPLADKYAKILGEAYKEIKYKDTTSRWGSCNHQKCLMLSWRLIMAPEKVLEYVVAHEVAHLKHMNHSANFWDAVSLLCQDYKLLRKWIKKEGSTLFNYKFCI